MTRSPTMARFLGLSVLVLALGCGGTSAPGRGDAAALDASGDGGHGSGDAGLASALCDQYVACVAASNPGALGLIREQYGAAGSCWRESPQLCEEACRTGLRQSHQAFPDTAACPACVSDHECSGSLPACATTTGECVACVSSAQCSVGVCDTAAHRCVLCVQHADCTQGGDRLCDPATHTCVHGCAGDQSCGGDTPHCYIDANGSGCVGCYSFSHCADGEQCANWRCCAPTVCGPGVCGPQYDPGCQAYVQCGACP